MNHLLVRVMVITQMFLLLIIHQAHGEDTPPAENLQTLISCALANNPELKGSEARWQMFANRVKQASSLDDPMLMLKIQNGIF